ncbi:hypothetical protein BGX24_000013 [Mortierella sp. AD032]|nr:hypothetical protein BGX24_000013 [Mortierella sp. AD032]
MPNLKRLHTHAEPHKTRIPIEDMIPLFSQLEELHFAGSWHNHEMRNEQIFSSNNNMTTPWRLKKLACNRPDITPTRFCSNLTYFEIVSTEHRTNLQTTSLRFLMACPKLETVKLPTSTSSNSFIDVAETLRSLEALRSLTFNISWRDELEVLCTSDLDSRITNNARYQEPESDPFTNMNQESIDPALLFARPGQEAHDSWGCKDLESLVFSLPRPIHYKTAEEECAYWQPIYRQIGQPSKLKSFEITCPKVQKDKHSGILQLSGAASLQRLVLHGTEAIAWSREETVDLLRVLPRLETLQLKPLKKGCSSKMRAWLR